MALLTSACLLAVTGCAGPASPQQDAGTTQSGPSTTSAAPSPSPDSVTVSPTTDVSGVPVDTSAIEAIFAASDIVESVKTEIRDWGESIVRVTIRDGADLEQLKSLLTQVHAEALDALGSDEVTLAIHMTNGAVLTDNQCSPSGIDRLVDAHVIGKAVISCKSDYPLDVSTVLEDRHAVLERTREILAQPKQLVDSIGYLAVASVHPTAGLSGATTSVHLSRFDLVDDAALTKVEAVAEQISSDAGDDESYRFIFDATSTPGPAKILVYLSPPDVSPGQSAEELVAAVAGTKWEQLCNDAAASLESSEFAFDCLVRADFDGEIGVVTKQAP